MQGLGEIAKPKERGLLLLAEMSSQGHLLDTDYQSATLTMAKAHSDVVMGFITQHALDTAPQWINMTPGVKLQPQSDQLGQCYVTPKTAIERGSDILIVGRAILDAEDSLATAKAYQAECWQQYLRRCTMGRPVSHQTEQLY
jgi:uridine monophosphate synthetase